LIGIGIDAVDVERFARALQRRPSMAARLFTDHEQQVGSGTAGLAARFAAKEAVMKALGVGIGAFQWTDVEVVRLASGQPALRVSGAAAALATEQGVGSWLVSLTHTSSLAEAVVAALP